MWQLDISNRGTKSKFDPLPTCGSDTNLYFTRDASQDTIAANLAHQVSLGLEDSLTN